MHRRATRLRRLVQLLIIVSLAGLWMGVPTPPRPPGCWGPRPPRPPMPLDRPAGEVAPR
jgi:hypothetical protein